MCLQCTCEVVVSTIKGCTDGPDESDTVAWIYNRCWISLMYLAPAFGVYSIVWMFPIMCLQMKHEEEVGRLQVETYALLWLSDVSHCYPTLTLKCLQTELAAFRSENRHLKVFHPSGCILATPNLPCFQLLRLAFVGFWQHYVWMFPVMCLQMKHKEEVGRLQVETYALLWLSDVSHCYPTLTLKCLQTELAAFRSENRHLKVFHPSGCILATPNLPCFQLLKLAFVGFCQARAISLHGFTTEAG